MPNIFFLRRVSSNNKSQHYNTEGEAICEDIMGGCLTLDREEALAKRRSNEIDKQLQEYAKNESNVIKILLLGNLIFDFNSPQYILSLGKIH